MQDSFDARMKGNVPETVKTKSSKGWMVCSIILLALLIGGGVFAGMIIMKGDRDTNRLSDVENQLKEKDEKLESIKEVAGVSSIDEITPELFTGKGYDSKYVYFPEAGMKVEIPDTLKSVSYLHSDRGSIVFWAVPKGFQYYPDFVDPEKNSSGMFAIEVSKKIDDKSKVCNSGNIPDGVICTGAHVIDAAVDGYEILAEGPHAVFSRDATGAKDETDAVKALREVLTNADNYSKI